MTDWYEEFRDHYINVVANVLAGTVHEDPGLQEGGGGIYDEKVREHGGDWPATAFTMVGIKRLQNIRVLLESVIGSGVPGDFVETGVWRGGASMMARAVLKAYGVTDRKVILCDSFEGLPVPDVAQFPADEGSNFHFFGELSVPLWEVKRNFSKLNLLDDQVVFVQGWFRETMSAVPSQNIAVLRLDGDMYESTILPLTYLYERFPNGGWVIVDDYHVVPAAKLAVDEFLDSKGLHPTLQEIDGVGIYWRKH